MILLIFINPFHQVSAVRTDGRRQQISYRLVAGNENGFFYINPQTGMIRVSDSSALDYETSPEINMTVQALGESPGGAPLHGYALVRINLLDLNDNPPMFSQAQYSSTVWEGNSKGTFVMQVRQYTVVLEFAACTTQKWLIKL